MSSYPFFLIHNYKVLGTTIYSQLPHSYNSLLYGHQTLKNIMTNNRGLVLNKFYNIDHKLSIDHLHIDTILDIGLIKIPIHKIKFIMIVREPIERFVSICNYHYYHSEHRNKTMKQHIELLKRNIGDDYFQHKFIKSRHNINVKLYKMEDREGIKNFFKQFNIDINLNIKENCSKRLYSIRDISPEDMIFLKRFYKEDYQLYNSI